MIDLYEWNIQEKMDGSVRESGTSIVRRICTNISRITFINFLKNIYFYVPIFFSDSLNQRKSFENHFTFFNSIVSLQFDENNSKSSNAKQSQIRAKIISKSKHIKKKHLRMEHHPQTSSFSVKHLQTRIAIRFLPPRDREDETDLYTQRYPDISCPERKK